MTGELQPLASNFAIVDKSGLPTQYFIRWAQQRQVDIGTAITLEQAQQLIDDWALHRSILTDIGLSGGGDLSADRTLRLVDTAVTPGTYGDATHSARVTVDQQGRLTAASQVAISGGGGGGGGGLYDISMGVPLAPTQIGDATKFAWSYNGSSGMNAKYTGGGLGGPNLAGWIMPLPGVTYHIAALMLHNNVGSNYYAAAIAFYGSGSGRLYSLSGFDVNYNQYEVQNWNSYNSRAGIVSSGYPSGAAYTTPLWYHLKFDGTTYFLGFSKDGANPVFMFSSTGGPPGWVGTIDGIFVGTFSETSDNVPGTSTTCLCYDDNADARVMGG